MSSFFNQTATLGDLPVSLGFEWVMSHVILSEVYIEHVPLLCSPFPLGMPLWLLKVCCLALEAQQAGDCAASSFWTSGKGREQ